MSIPRIACAVIALIFIAGCAGTNAGSFGPQGGIAQSTIATGAPHSSRRGVIQDPGYRLSDDPKEGSPCDIAGFWYFHGSCTTFSIGPKGLTVRLAAYRGLSLQQSFPTNFTTKTDAFVTGDGTSDADITGTFETKAFPVYGSIGCASIFGGPMPCPGKALLYTVIENAGSVTIGFNATPGFTITNPGSFHGTNCQVILLKETSGGFVWLRLDSYGKLKQNTLTFKPLTAAVQYAPHSKAVFSFICN